jgi:hypothetical protein
MLCLLGTTEPVQRLEAAPRMTQQCQLSATVTGRSAAGIDVTVGMTIGGPTVIAATDGRRQRSSPTTNQALFPPPGSHPPLKRQESLRALSHSIKTTHPCSVPQTTRARATYAPRIARPIALTPWQGTRHLWQAKRAPFHLRHDDRLKKGAPHCLNLYPDFLLSLSLSCHRDRRKRAPSPPTDQRFEGCALQGSATASEHSSSEPFTDQGIEGWPLGRVR